MSDVRLYNLTKIYKNGFHAVKGINLEIKDGEFMVLVGPSGCAKSTTLRMIAGLEEISDGELYIGDRKVNELTPDKRNIAMVFQDYALYPHMTIYDNMAYGLRIMGLAANEIDKRVKNAADILGLMEQLNKKPKALSGGQRQRVAVGRTIVREPEVFLFDEPLSNLDAKLRVHMRAEIIRIQKTLNTTMVYVTHDQVEAMTMGDRICVLNAGEIMQVDSPLQLYENPENRFVATFIGSPAMNMFQGTVKQENNNLLFVSGGLKIRIPEHVSKSIKDSNQSQIEMGIRPEHIRPEGLEASKPAPESGFNTIEGKVTLIELMGNEIIVHLDGDAGQAISRTDPHAPVKKGQNKSFFVDPEFCHFFDMQTGARL